MQTSRAAVGLIDEYTEIRRILEQCVAQSRLACASLVSVRRRSKRTFLAVQACYPSDSMQMSPSRAVLRLARRALRTQEPQAMVNRRYACDDSDHYAFDRDLVIVTPVSTQATQATQGNETDVIGQVLVVWGPAAGADLGIVGLLRQQAALVAYQLGDARSSSSDGAIGLPHRRLEQLQLPFAPTGDALLHELRAPLAAARYALESLGRMKVRERNRSLPLMLRTSLLGIAEAQFVLLWFSQLRSIERGAAPLNIVAVSVRDVISRARALLPAAADRIQVSIATDVEWLAADPLWLTQALTNLFENALRHGRQYGATQVDVRLAPHERVVLTVQNQNDKTLAPEEPDMHEMRARSDDLTSQGIGLKLVRYFISEMGGDVWIEQDQPGETTVALSLPVASCTSE